MLRVRWVVCLVAWLATPSLAADDSLVLELSKPGRMLMLRHAHAPGNGDPPEFRLANCSTQRNLDARGRDQARQIGRRLVKAGIKQARIYSSQWCRCLETARLLDLGPVEALPALNSFYPRPEDREPRMATLRTFLADQPTDGALLILVTHQFTIAELTRDATPSGGGAVFQLDGTGTPRLLGRLTPD